MLVRLTDGREPSSLPVDAKGVLPVGQVRFGGRDVTRVPVQKRNVSMVFQQFINYPNFTVYENIASPLRMAGGHSAAEIGRRVRATAEIMHIDGLLDRLPVQLSGGQQQRTAIARALIKDTELLLLDEPLVNLDPHHQGDLVGLTKSLRDELGVTILFSAHELNPLLGALDRVLYLARGQAALGTVDDVITGPVLSRLYGTEIDVIRLKGRIFVISGDQDVERDRDRHDDGSRHTQMRSLLGAQPSDV